jgi:hypothetical protein
MQHAARMAPHTLKACAHAGDGKAGGHLYVEIVT